jgi:hypothetical protein
MALETVDILVEDDQVIPAPVDGVVVRVFDATGTTFITEGTTGSPAAPGHVEFTLNGDDPPIQYSLRFFKSGASFVSPQAIEVYTPPANAPTGANNFVVPASIFTIPEATDPRCCRVSGYIYDGGCRPRNGIDIHFIPQFNPLIIDSLGVLGERVSHRTDKDGYISLDLWRNGCYLATIESHENIARQVVVPDRSSINIMDLLFPVVVKVEYSPAPPWNIPVGTELEIAATVTSSDFRTLEGTAQGDVLYESDDASIAAVTVRDDKIILRGIAPGSANLVASRKDLSVVHVPDNGIDGASASITVS